MSTLTKTALALLAAFAAGSLFTSAAVLEIAVRPMFKGEPLMLGSLRYENTAGQRHSVTRLSYLLSGFAVEREAGGWVELPDHVAWMDAAMERSSIRLDGVPPGPYRAVRFRVGLDAQTNHGDAARWSANHPLNPNLNGLHWNWQGGYVFAAVEGHWRGKDGAISGYSYHLANDTNLMTVELPLALDLAQDQSLHVALDVGRILDDLTITDESTATHSRPGDLLAAQLRDNLSRAFRIERLSPLPTRTEAPGRMQTLIAPDATPYRLTFPAPFPRPALPTDNPITEEGVELGRRLFHSPRLSGNQRQSCATCHQPPNGFSDAHRFSTGAFGELGTRQSMPLFNLAWKSSFFWDGRAPSLRAQVLQPIQNPIEMHAALPEVVDRIAEGRDYADMFARAFGTTEVNADRIARALEQFILTLVSGDSKFDRAMRGRAQLTAEEQRGFELFNTEYDPRRGQHGADCFHCHGGALFQSTAFANNGLDATPVDAGRLLATKLEGDRGKFAVPSLRNVALTAPYMHDGRFRTLEEVVEHYDHGVQPGPTLDPNLAKHPREGLQLSAEDKRALVAFLQSLTDDTLRVPPPGRPGFPPLTANTHRPPPPPFHREPGPGKQWQD